jgi:hypothetical protein
MTMTDAAAIDEAIRRTGIGHYRYLCEEYPDVREGYRGLVRRIAAGPDPAAYPPVAVDYGTAAAPAGGPCGHC